VGLALEQIVERGLEGCGLHLALVVEDVVGVYVPVRDAALYVQQRVLGVLERLGGQPGDVKLQLVVATLRLEGGLGLGLAGGLGFLDRLLLLGLLALLELGQLGGQLLALLAFLLGASLVLTALALPVRLVLTFRLLGRLVPGCLRIVLGRVLLAGGLVLGIVLGRGVLGLCLGHAASLVGHPAVPWSLQV
jgi:hypothetical protein